MYRSTSTQAHAGTAYSESRAPHCEDLLDGRAAREGRVPLVHSWKVLGEVKPVDVLHEPRRRHLVPPIRVQVTGSSASTGFEAESRT